MQPFTRMSKKLPEVSLNLNTRILIVKNLIERFHLRGQHLCKFTGTKERVYIRTEFSSHRTDLGHQHSRRFIVLGHQYGRYDVM